MWPYHDAEGRLVGYAARVEFVGEDGQRDKDVLPITYCRISGERCGWRARALPAPRPLYRLPELIADPAAPVIVTEGEKKADAVPIAVPRPRRHNLDGRRRCGEAFRLVAARRPQGDHLARS